MADHFDITQIGFSAEPEVIINSTNLSTSPLPWQRLRFKRYIHVTLSNKMQELNFLVKMFFLKT